MNKNMESSTFNKIPKDSTTGNPRGRRKAEDVNPEETQNQVQAPEPTAAQVHAKLNEEALRKPFHEERKIVIALVSDINIGSVYRQVNSRYIPERHDSIGGSVTSGRILTSNYKEMAAYMPALVGCSPNEQTFTTRVQRWFNNISLPVGPDGVTLNINFNWNTKQDYLDFKEGEAAILNEYDRADKSNPKLLKEAIERYVSALNALESTRYDKGMPEKVDHYLTYRHCLLYPHVAKDTAVIGFDQRIRFYIRDEEREATRLKRTRIQANKARRNYLDAIDDATKFKAIFVCYCAANKMNVLDNLLLDRAVQEKMLDEFSIKDPEKFNKLFNNNQLELQAFLEECIAKGELMRSDVNQTILTPEGAFIGNNMKEALAFFSNPDNAEFKKMLETKLKL